MAAPLLAFPNPAQDLLDGSERIFWLYLLTSAALALIVALGQARRARAEPQAVADPDTAAPTTALTPATAASPRRSAPGTAATPPARAPEALPPAPSLVSKYPTWGALRATGPAVRRWLAAPDTRLDLRYFLVNWGTRTALAVPLVALAHRIVIGTWQGLAALAPPPFLGWSQTAISVAYTLALFLAGDASRYWLHRLMHRNRWLWPIHRVHHSAEVLSPLTFYRLHPVETLLFALRHAVVAGGLTGLFLFLFGPRLTAMTVFGDNLLVVALFSLTANLRHSPIRLGYGRVMEHLLISPAQHQIHHDSRHLTRNYGSCLAIWDWMGGTLTLSADPRTARLHFGLAGRGRRGLDSVGGLLLTPIREISTRLQRRRP